jgi:hypothetical protein
MASYLILKDNAKNIDSRLKEKLFANYHKIIEQRRSKKINNLKATVRQMCDDGTRRDEGLQLWADAFSSYSGQSPFNIRVESSGDDAMDYTSESS